MDHSRPQNSAVPVEREREQAGVTGGTRGAIRVQTFIALRHRDFVLLWLSNLCNASANWFQQFTIPWLVWDMSHSPVWVGIAAGMRSFPFLVVSLTAADNSNRSKIR